MLAYLDQNIYGNIQRGASERQLLDALAAVGARPAASIELLVEAARIADPATRAQRVNLVRRLACDGYLEPPTYLQCRETLAEVRRLHPMWARTRREDPLVRQILRGWRTWFSGAARDDDRAFLDALLRDEIERNRTRHKQHRRVAGDERRLDPEETMPEPVRLRALSVGYRLPEATTWKAVQEDAGRLRTWVDHMTRGQVYADVHLGLIDQDPRQMDVQHFLGTFLKRGRPPSPEAWARFCFVEADVARWPRHRLVSGMTLFQRHEKYSPGNTVDAGHAVHAVDVGIFMTSDADFAAILGVLGRLGLHRARVAHVRADHADLERAIAG